MILLYNRGMEKDRTGSVAPSAERKVKEDKNTAVGGANVTETSVGRKSAEKKGKEMSACEARKARCKQLSEMFSRRHYCLLMLVCAVMRARFRVRSVLSPAFRKQKKEGAMLVLSNHVSAFDFAYFSTPFLGKKVSFVVAESMMYSMPLFAKMIKGYRAITKKQFYADYTCIKNIKKYLDAGISVILCPEGKVSAEGKTGPVAFSIAKLVKWLGYPVASCVIQGAGITRPKWAYTSRTGRVECRMDVMFDAEQVKTLSAAQIMDGISASLAHNEHVWQIENGVKFRGKRYAEGLERLLYVCPECGAEFTLNTSGDEISCSACGFRARYEHTGKIVSENAENCPKRIDLWFDKEKQIVAEQVEKEDFALSERVKLFVENDTKNGYREVADGVLSLDKNDIIFRAKGELSEADANCRELVFHVRNFVTVANLPGTSLDMYDENHTYRMVFTDRKASTKYVLSIEALNASSAK